MNLSEDETTFTMRVRVNFREMKKWTGLTSGSNPSRQDVTSEDLIYSLPNVLLEKWEDRRSEGVYVSNVVSLMSPYNFALRNFVLYRTEE